MPEVVGIGSAVFDVLMTTNGFPKEDKKMEGIETKTQGGGPCATALVAMSKLGVSSSYMGTLGDDMYGKIMKEQFERFGVETSHIRTIEGAISFHSVILLNLQNSSRTCVWNRGTVASPSEEDIDLETLKNAKVLHLDGHQLETAIYAAKKAREYGVEVSLDAGGTYPGIERLLPLVDILIPSEEFALKITGCKTAVEAAAVLWEKYQPKILIITQGSRGGFLWENGTEKRYPAFKVDAIDSNGAGDTFHGAFVAARVKGMEVMEAATFASATSALKCTRFGAQEGIPGFDEVIEFMRR